MKLAISVWNDRIAPVFDASESAVVYSFQTDGSVEKIFFSLSQETVQEKVGFLYEKGVTALICGAISEKGSREVLSKGIELIPFVAGDITDVLNAWTNRSSKIEYSMPGCRFAGNRNRKQRRCGGRRKFGR
ncbi:NifB/NifX family molybdenum-iron cluster-binding protein [candidate division WOR-3 bacterium]|nr:NifB/NifX family molybdenum-iron cluster-binding protein [candidate division WOR-3 bacterium]